MSEMQRVQPTNNANRFFSKECLDVSKVETNWDQINHQIVALKKSSSNTEIVKAAEEFSTNYNARHKAKLEYVEQNKADDPRAREELLKITKEAVVKIQKAIGQQEAIDFIKCIDTSCIQQNWKKVHNSISELENSNNPELKSKANKFVEKYAKAFHENRNDETKLLSITSEHLDSLKKIINPEYCPKPVLPAASLGTGNVSREAKLSTADTAKLIDSFEKEYWGLKERLKPVRLPEDQRYQLIELDKLRSAWLALKARNGQVSYGDYDKKLLEIAPGALKSVSALVEVAEENKRYNDEQKAIAKKVKDRESTIEESVKKLVIELEFSPQEVSDFLLFDDRPGFRPALKDNGELKYDDAHLQQIKNYLEILKKPQDLRQDELNALIAQMKNDPFFTENKAANSTEKNLLNTLISRAEDAIIGGGIKDLAVPSTEVDGLSFKLSIKDGATVYQAVIDSDKWAGPEGDIFISASDRIIEHFGFLSEKLDIKFNESRNIMTIQLTKRQTDGSFTEPWPFVFERKQ